MYVTTLSTSSLYVCKKGFSDETETSIFHAPYEAEFGRQVES